MKKVRRKVNKIVATPLCSAMILTNMPIEIFGEDMNQIENPEANVVSSVGEPVIFQDSGLEAAVREVLKKTTGVITKTDMESLTTLNGGGRKIASLEGLQYAVNLTRLNLPNNQISDIAVLKGLKKLEYLNLGDNVVTDLSPLSETYTLKELALYRNKVKNISPLKNLTSITSLDLFENEVVNLDDIRLLTNLTYLRLTGNGIEDITALSEMERLETLILNKNKISDISPMKKMVKLKLLEAEDNNISDMEVISFLKSLTELRLGANNIEYIPSLVKLENFKVLNMHTNKLKDISNLSQARKLERVHLLSNEIEDISCFSGMEFLSYLSVQDNKVSDISVVENLPSLDRLIVTNNKIKDYSPLKNIKSVDNMTALEIGVQEVIESVEIVGKEVENPFIDIDGNHLELIFEDGMVSLSDDKATIRFADPKEKQSYRFTAETKPISNNSSYATISGSFIIEDVKSPIKFEILKEDCNENGTKEVKIRFSTISDPISKIVLPDGTEVYGEEVVFIADKNGEYTFKIYDIEGSVYEEVVTIEGILENEEGVEDKDNVVKQNNAPVIHAQNINIYRGYAIDLLEYVRATDEEDGELDVSIILNEVVFSEVGTYKVIYAAIDSEGETSTKEILVTVRALNNGTHYIREVMVNYGEEVDVEQIIVEIAEKHNLKNTQIIRNDVDISKAGDYEVVFKGVNTKEEQEIHAFKVSIIPDLTENTPDDIHKVDVDTEVEVETGVSNGKSIIIGCCSFLLGVCLIRIRAEKKR